MFAIISFTADDIKLSEIAFAIRRKVFVEEQHVDQREEYDHEEESIHYLLYIDETPAGTARWRETEEGIKLERFALMKEFRNRGAGSFLVEEVLKDVANKGRKIYLHSQARAVNLYQRAGFVAEGELFYEAGIPHYKMVYDPSFKKA